MVDEERGGRRRRGRGGEIEPRVQRLEPGRRDGPRQGGVDGAEADRRHDDAGRRQLLGGDPGEGFDGRLARDIGGLAFERERHGDGGDVHDAPGALTDHDLADGLQAVERAEVVHPHEALGGLARRQQQGVHRGRAGVIDQQVDPAGLGDGRDRGADGGFVGDVHDAGMEVRMGERLRAAGEAMHDPAVGQQAFGQGAAQAAGRAGDEGGGGHF